MIKDIKHFLDSEVDIKALYIYGGGWQARVLADLFESCSIQIMGIIVERGSEVLNLLDNYRCFYFDEEFDAEILNAEIVIGVNERWNEELVNKLSNKGFINIWISNKWNEDNLLLRDIVFERNLLQHGFSISETEYSYKADKIFFRIMNNKEKSYRAMLTGEWFDFMTASLFGDGKTLSEGPYEYGNITINPGEIVMDVGANIGMFACLAAAKGATVYAFEPTLSTYKQLCDNAAINRPFILPQNLAVSDKVGKSLFYINSYSKDDDSGTNTMIKTWIEHKLDRFIETEVDTITLDDFVETRGIKQVDFIKADIEGAERFMLLGAKKVLRDFAPKLAICTYHLPDDPEVLETIIREANPNYVITHKWKKLYAYVPK